MLVFRRIASRNVQEGGRKLVYAVAVADQDTHGKFIQHNKVNP